MINSSTIYLLYDQWRYQLKIELRTEERVKIKYTLVSMKSTFLRHAILRSDWWSQLSARTDSNQSASSVSPGIWPSRLLNIPYIHYTTLVLFRMALSCSIKIADRGTSAGSSLSLQLLCSILFSCCSMFT